MWFWQLKLEEKRHSAAAKEETESLGSDSQAEGATWRFIKRGPNYLSWKQIKTFSGLYKNVSSYRLNGMRKTILDRSSKEMGKVEDFIKRMEIPLHRHQFNVDDPTKVLDFLARAMQEANFEKIPEAQSFLTLPSLFFGYVCLQSMGRNGWLFFCRRKEKSRTGLLLYGSC